MQHRNRPSGKFNYWEGDFRKSLKPYLLWWSLITDSSVVAWASTVVWCMRDARRHKKQIPSNILAPSRPDRTMKVAHDWYNASVRVKNSEMVKILVHCLLEHHLWSWRATSTVLIILNCLIYRLCPPPYPLITKGYSTFDHYQVYVNLFTRRKADSSQGVLGQENYLCELDHQNHLDYIYKEFSRAITDTQKQNIPGGGSGHLPH